MAGKIQKLKEFIATRDLPLKRVIFAGAICTTVFVTLSYLPVLQVIESNLSLTPSFRFRAQLGQDPKLDEKIKIFAFDDKTLATLKRSELQPEEWVDLLNLFNERKPRAIFIDKVFGTGLGDNKATEAFNKIAPKTPLIVGAFLADKPIAFRTPLNLEREEYSLKSFLSKEKKVSLSDLQWIPQTTGTLYGPHESIESSIPKIGHIIYDGNGKITPFFKMNTETAVPHAAFLLDEKISLTSSSIKVKNKEIPLNHLKQVVLNLASPIYYQEKTFSLLPILERAKKKQGLPELQEDSIVMILPALFTGNTDFKETAFGEIPGGYTQISLFNSVITQKWITPFNQIRPLTIVMGIASSLAGWLLPIAIAPYLIVFSSIFIAFMCLFMFSFFSFYVAWFLPVTCFFLTGLIVFGDRARVVHQRAETVKNAFEGLVAPEVLKDLIRRPAAIKLEPVERVITVMFLDITAFSLVAENYSPDILFTYLKNRLSIFSEIVHKYGGIVDKTMGDGLLCFFGYRYDGTNDPNNHAKQALLCSHEIQVINAQHCLEYKNHGKPINPLRIGLNSGFVYIGNVGNSRRIDFTLIGHTVNFAKRLEESCENFRVMIGSVTHDLITSTMDKDARLPRRYLIVKHHTDLQEAYEYDPFSDKGDLVQNAMAAYRDSIGLQRDHERWFLPSQLQIKAEIKGLVDALLVDFSLTGFSFTSPVYLSPKVKITLQLTCVDDPQLLSWCKEKNIVPIEGEIRWGRPVEGVGFRHGFRITNLNDEQKLALADRLKEIMQNKFQPQEQSEAS